MPKRASSNGNHFNGKENNREKTHVQKRGRKQQAPVPPINIRVASSRRRTMPFFVAMVTALLLLFVVVYVVRSVHTALTPSIATEVVRMGDRGIQHSVTGIIARYENVVNAPRDGQIVWEVNETHRVRRGTHIASIIDTETAERIAIDRALLDEDIRRLHERRHYSESDPVVQRINNSLQNTMDRNMHHFSTLNLTAISSLFNDLDNLTSNRNQIIINDSYGAVGGEISRQHHQLTAQQEMSSTNIYAPLSGIVFTIIDGHENEVTPLNMRELTRSQISAQLDYRVIIPARDVQEGEPMFKIVGNTWYIIAHIPNNMIQGFTEDTDRAIYIQNAATGNYEPITMRIIDIEPFTTDSRVIFRSNRNVLDFLNQRNISIRTTDVLTSGLQIPNSAIVTRRYIRIPVTHIHGNEHTGFFVHLPAYYGLRQIQIEISERNEEYVYIREDTHELIMGDTMIPATLQGENYTITESSVREDYGVFRATLGYARFTAIHIDGQFSDADGEYTLLNPARNTSLRQFIDTIVTDASTVNDGDIIR